MGGAASVLGIGCVERAAIKLYVTARRVFPSEVAAHRLVHPRRPRVLILIALERASDRLVEGVRCERIEQEPGGVVVHSVADSADPPANDEATVALRAHLCQPARLVLRRHQQQVAARYQSVLDAVRESELRAHMLWTIRGDLSEPRLVSLIPRSQKHELRVEHAQRSTGEDDVESLLLYQPAAHAEDRHPLPLRQPKCALQRGLAIRLVRRIPASVVRRYLLVRGRIPDALVNSVRDPLESIAHRSEHRVETESSFGRAQLVRVAGTHGDREIAESEAAFQEVHLSVPFQLMVVEGLGRNTQVADDGRRKVSLISGVVDRYYDRRPPKTLAQIRVLSHVDERESRMPVGRAYKQRAIHQRRYDLERGARERIEPSRSVRAVGAALHVNPLAIEIPPVVHEENCRTSLDICVAKETNLLPARPHA